MCSLYDDELSYIDRLIADDVRNNSAWNQRFFVLKHTGFTSDVLQREIDYVMRRIRFVKNNESTWNFLRGLLQQGDGTMDQFSEVHKVKSIRAAEKSKIKKFSLPLQVVEFCEELYTSGIRSPYLIAFLIDLYEEKCIRGDPVDNVEELSAKVYEYCELMATNVDKIREKYWKYVAGNFRIQMAKSGQQNTSKKPAETGGEGEPLTPLTTV